MVYSVLGNPDPRCQSALAGFWTPVDSTLWIWTEQVGSPWNRTEHKEKESSLSCNNPHKVFSFHLGGWINGFVLNCFDWIKHPLESAALQPEKTHLCPFPTSDHKVFERFLSGLKDYWKPLSFTQDGNCVKPGFYEWYKVFFVMLHKNNSHKGLKQAVCL